MPLKLCQNPVAMYSSIFWLNNWLIVFSGKVNGSLRLCTYQFTKFLQCLTFFPKDIFPYISWFDILVKKSISEHLHRLEQQENLNVISTDCRKGFISKIWEKRNWELILPLSTMGNCKMTRKALFHIERLGLFWINGHKECRIREWSWNNWRTDRGGRNWRSWSSVAKTTASEAFLRA